MSVETAEEDAMENRDSGPAPAGIDLTATGLSAAVQNLQVFAEEIGRASLTSFEQNAKLIDDLSTAREVGDIVAIQIKFMTGMLDTFNEQIRLMMSRMANFPLGAPNLAADFTWPIADLARTAEKAAKPAVSTASDAGLKPNGATASNTHPDFETAADLSQAEAEAPQTTAAAIEQVVEPEPVAVADKTPASEDAVASATTEAAFTQAQDLSDELGDAEADAVQDVELSVTETTQWAAKASRDAWQELAKAAAELLKAEPLLDEAESGDETPDPPRPSAVGDHKV
jgi:hypothetical protein